MDSMKRDNVTTHKHREGRPAIEEILQRIENNSRLQTDNKLASSSPKHASLKTTID
jgi:hypothetical protein